MSQLLLVILGLVFLWLGADLVINAAQRIAKSLDISGAFIGLTILSIGTSFPEIMTHIVSSIDILKGIEASGIAVGTNVGSNLFQITFVVGIVGLLLTIKSNRTMIHRDYLIMLGSIFILWLFSLNGRISRPEGAILALLYIIYMIYLGRKEKVIEKNPFRTNYIKDLALMLSGLVILLIAADFVVDKAMILSEAWGIAQSFIGTLIVGIGTALPELTTALVGIFKRADDISLGTLIGSNITNPLLAVGIGAAISGYTIDKYLLWYDIPAWFFLSVVVMLFFYRKNKLLRGEALVLLLLYFSYAIFKIFYLDAIWG